MKTKNIQRWRIVFILSVFLYLIAVVISIRLVENVPSEFVDVQKTTINKVEQSLIDVTKTNRIAEYREIAEKYYVDFLIYDSSNNKIIYSTINVKDDPSIINNNVNHNIIAQRKVIDSSQNNIKIWLTQYYESPQNVFDIWITLLFKIIIMLLGIVVVIMLILFYNSIRPLRRLKDNIVNISSFHLDKIKNNKNNNEYDALSKELYKFSVELERNIKETGNKYSALERDLQIKNNAITYKNKMLGSLSHDLKAPLSVINLNLEKLNRNDLVEREKIFIVKDLHDRIDNLVADINNINKLSYDENDESYHKIENFDLIKMIIETLHEYDELFDSKGFYVDLDIDEGLIIKANKIRIKQLLRNALSNVYNYALKDAWVKIVCFKEKDLVKLSFYNDSKAIPEDKINQMFNLFYSNSDNKFSTGTGLYTIKTIVIEMSGEVTFENKENGVELNVTFKI